MKIGIVGCGLNSDYHISFAKAYEGLKVVGLVDKDESRAKECALRFGIKDTFASIGEMVAKEKPDIVHIITPPYTHFQLAEEAIKEKCHVLIEKPLAFSLKEAEKIFDLAEENGIKVCAMHNHFFDPCMMKARDLIAGRKAGKVINVESYYGLNTRIDAFRRYPYPNVLPWLYSLPGGVFHDFLPHPLYVMLPFIGRPLEIEVKEKSFGELPQNLSDELRILIKGEKAFGTLTFSFSAKPHLHFLRVYGTRMMLNVDFNTMSTVVHPLSSLPKAAQKATYNLTESKQLFSNTVANVWNFGRGKLKPYQGMKTLIHKFYDHVSGKGEIPVSREDALAVIGAMDEILGRVKNIRLNFDPISPMKKSGPEQGIPKILVTGGTGFLGKRLVEILVQKGYSVRVLARKLSNIEPLQKLEVEILFGDVANLESLQAAFPGIEVVVHAAADTAGNEKEGEWSTIQGTRNVLELCGRFGIKKLIYISSCAVYGVSDYKKGALVEEDASLERFPEKRGFYSYAKLKADQIVAEAMANTSFPIVSLRPGTIWGSGGEIFTPMMGFSLGEKVFAVIGNGKFVLPFVYIDNLIEAVLKGIEKQDGAGGIYNVVDPERINKREYVNRLVKRLYPQARCFYIPYSFLYTAVYFQEKMFSWMGKKPVLTRYRLDSSQKSILYDSSKLQRELGWNPPVSLQEGLERVLEYEKTKTG